MARYDDNLDNYTPSRGLFGLGLKWYVWTLAFIVIATVIMIPVSLALGWFSTGAQIISPENVRAQFQAAYDDENALKATAQNICTLDKAVAAETNPDLKSQRVSQVLAQEQNYQRIQNHYNAYVSDPFRAKLVRPADLPYPAPTETEMKAQVCAGG